MVIEVKNIKKIYKKNLRKITALDDISFTVKKGRILGILGPNGAGKTTLLKIITGITKPDDGEIIFSENKNEFIAKENIGFLPENPSFLKNITAYELLEFSLNLYRKGKDKKKITETLELVSLFENMNDRVKSFSKGMVQRLGIAQAIIHSPDIIILDEPMSGLDPIGRKMVKELILTKKRENKTILFSTHNLDDIDALCDDVIMIKNGKKVIDDEIINLRKSNAYSVEIVNKQEREILTAEKEADLWDLLSKIKKDNKKIISVKSDLSGELERYYEK